MTLTRREIVSLLNLHELRPSRALGQNFVVDPNTVRRIARLAGVGPGDRVVEIGAGLGSLTLALAETGASVTAVEVDRGLLPVLRSMVEPAGVRVVEGDAMRLDWDTLLAGGSWTLVANLPYNLATPLVADLLDGQPAITRMVVMVQREVGERLAAQPGDDGYGAVSVKVRYWATATLVGRVPSTVFLPQPKVESVLVDIRRRPVPAVPAREASPDELFALVKMGFGQRRKMLRRSLAGRVGADLFVRAGVDPSSRPEELDVEAWGRLAATGHPPEPVVAPGSPADASAIEPGGGARELVEPGGGAPELVAVEPGGGAPEPDAAPGRPAGEVTVGDHPVVGPRSVQP